MQKCKLTHIRWENIFPENTKKIAPFIIRYTGLCSGFRRQPTRLE